MINMKKCEECGKTLGIFEGYKHPTMGKTHSLCSLCFDQVSVSVNNWREFIIKNIPNRDIKHILTLPDIKPLRSVAKVPVLAILFKKA